MNPNEQLDLYTAWPKDACAMEQAVIPDPGNHAKESASYRALIARAREPGEDETVRAREQILPDEQATARDLEASLPPVVRYTLQAQHAAL